LEEALIGSGAGGSADTSEDPDVRLPRFTIGGILAIVLFAAVGLAGRKEPTELWDGAVFGLTLVMLLASVLQAVHAGGSRRAYWLGFALFGWAYVALCQVPAIEARLPTTHGLSRLDGLLPGRSTVATAPAPVGLERPRLLFGAPGVKDVTISNLDVDSIHLWDASTGRRLVRLGGSPEAFIRVGHSLFALILAFVGANASRFLHAREASPGREPPDQETSTSSPTS
jgi:hypothetical protein